MYIFTCKADVWIFFLDCPADILLRKNSVSKFEKNKEFILKYLDF